MKYRFRTKPRDYQLKALRFLVGNKGVGALLMDPGTGKTWVVINYMGAYVAKHKEMKVLIAAPLSALDTWVDQTQEHLGVLVDEEGEEHDIPTRIYVLNDGSILDKSGFIKGLDDEFEGLTMVVINHDAFKYRHKVPGLKTVTVRDRILDSVAFKWVPDLIVVDEMHRLKTHSSNLSTAFKKLGQHSFMRIGMTGTVAPHSPLDFFGQWQFLNPERFEAFRPRAWDNFRYYYAIYGGWEGKQVVGFYDDRLKEMKKKIRKDSYIVKKRDALDLPPVTHIKVPVHLDKEIPYYKEMGKELMVLLPSGKQSISPNTLTKMLRLRQITGGVVGYKEVVGLDGEGEPREAARTEDIGDSKLRVMIDKIETIADAGEKQVVFAHFRRDVARIYEACQDTFNPRITRGKRKGQRRENIPVYMITGDTSGKNRKLQRKAFYEHNGPAIFVAQKRTVSLAINEFVVASYGHFYSYSQLRDDFIQAIDRLDRQGQRNPVTFYHYIVPKSIDQAILESHLEKGRLEAVVTKRAKEILTLGEET